LNYLLEAYQELGDAMFDNPQFFDKLAGTRELRVQLQLNANEETIRASWRTDLDDYLIKRKKYLLYP
jgi:uncharacterized protein YbbC (DUF1343 family)